MIWDATMFEIYGLPPVVPMPYTRWAAAVWPEDRAAAESSLQLAVATKDSGASEFRIALPDGSRIAAPAASTRPPSRWHRFSTGSKPRSIPTRA
jgi:hypothetical protein